MFGMPRDNPHLYSSRGQNQISVAFYCDLYVTWEALISIIDCWNECDKNDIFV